MTVGDVPANMDPRTPAFVLCVCAVVIAIGTLSKNWVTAGLGIGVGPTGVEACLGSVCRGLSWRGISRDIPVFATISLVAGITAAVACGLFGVLVLAERRNKLPAVRRAKLALAIAALAMFVFELRLLLEGHEVSVSWAGVPILASVLTGAVMLRKLAPHLHQAPLTGVRRLAPSQAIAVIPIVTMPAIPTLPTGPQLQAPPSCPRCGTRLAFIPDKQRWFCVREQEYV